MKYAEQISQIDNISFEKIRDISVTHINSIPSEKRDQLWQELKRGTAVLDSDDQLCQYIYSFGLMHQAKMRKAFGFNTFSEILCGDYEIIDWGCGQGLATVCFLDELKRLKINKRVKRVTLIEPSLAAINRANIHVSAFLDDNVEVCSVNKYLDEVNSDEIRSNTPITVHLFSNILDVQGIDLQSLSKKIGADIEGCHYLFCVSL